MDIDALMLASFRGDAKTMSKMLPELISELRRLQDVERKYDAYLQDTLDVTAAVLREFPNSKLMRSEVVE